MSPSSLLNMHLKSQHKAIQIVKDSKENDLSFNMYSVLKFRLQNPP